MKTVALRSLGCKVNAYETEGMQQILQQKGYSIVPFDSKADIYIVNTCSVTNIADQKSRQMLHRAKKLNPDAIVVAAGCYVQTGREVLEEDVAVDIIVGNNEKRNIAEVLEEYLANNSDGIGNKSEDTLSFVRDLSAKAEYEEMQVIVPAEHTRGFIKIQDGCNRFCTYCVIPYARGRIRSRRIEDVLTEAENFAKAGIREIVLTGIHISSFGLDRGESEMIALLTQLSQIEGIESIRLGSLEPGLITPEFAEALRSLDKVCPHFHLSLQSGSKSVLGRMNRHYTPDEYYEKVELLRQVYDNPAITTDIIVGFPGETEEEYVESYEFARRVGFFEIHVFKYSKRDGTVAAKMPNQIPEQEKTHRSEKLIALGEKMTEEYCLAHQGKDALLLVEEIKKIDGKEYWVGHTREYIVGAIPVEEAGEDIKENSYVRGRFLYPIKVGIVLFEKAQ